MNKTCKCQKRLLATVYIFSDNPCKNPTEPTETKQKHVIPAAIYDNYNHDNYLVLGSFNGC